MPPGAVGQGSSANNAIPGDGSGHVERPSRGCSVAHAAQGSGEQMVPVVRFDLHPCRATRGDCGYLPRTHFASWWVLRCDVRLAMWSSGSAPSKNTFKSYNLDPKRQDGGFDARRSYASLLHFSKPFSTVRVLSEGCALWRLRFTVCRLLRYAVGHLWCGPVLTFFFRASFSFLMCWTRGSA